MKYKIGDKVFFKSYGFEFVSCEIIGLLEKTKRYRVRYMPSWGNKPDERMVPEIQLFLNLSEGYDSEIAYAKKQIEQLESKIVLFNQKKREVT